MVFRYLPDADDYKAAVKCGFSGYPAFRPGTVEHHQGVLEAFTRRLPPRAREDFSDFLARHRLPDPFPLSDMALLGYTGAALPSDGFALVPDFPDEPESFDYITELAGVRHVHGTDLSDVSAGDEVQFAVDRENPVERDALFVTHNGKPLGYVNRALRNRVAHWAAKGHLSARIERLNAKPERPLVYVRIEYR
ncbi:HIRAN domain-containing protein [Paraburkholderia sp. J41]|uniref:HIRAN domain-containing protein n=1 Tax=Paraburkholderia sp. J41 TaxID=2805433 RepID=UPI002AC35662|nr:HIRAN domain-containing protein [Paraburkholderia sp. J41]